MASNRYEENADIDEDSDSGASYISVPARQQGPEQSTTNDGVVLQLQSDVVESQGNLVASQGDLVASQGAVETLIDPFRDLKIVSSQGTN